MPTNSNVKFALKKIKEPENGQKLRMSKFLSPSNSFFQGVFSLAATRVSSNLTVNIRINRESRIGFVRGLYWRLLSPSYNAIVNFERFPTRTLLEAN